MLKLAGSRHYLNPHNSVRTQSSCLCVNGVQGCAQTTKGHRESAQPGNLSFSTDQRTARGGQEQLRHRVPFCHCRGRRDTELRSLSSPAVLCQYAGHKPAVNPRGVLTNLLHFTNVCAGFGDTGVRTKVFVESQPVFRKEREWQGGI